MNIFVSGASGIVGYGILKSLSNKRFILYGSTIYEFSAAQRFGDHFIKAIPTNDVNYLGWFIETIKKNKIDVAFPGIDADLYFWSENRKLIEETGVVLILNNSELIELCKDKWNFYLEMIQFNVTCCIKSSLENDFYQLEKELGLPFLLKPRQGFGSKGIVVINSKEDYLPFRNDVGKLLLAQEFVGSDDEEFTVAAFGDGNGSFTGLFSMKRTLAKEGYTQSAEVVKNKKFMNTIKELSSIFKPIGPTNFQFRIKDGNLKLLEINPRISSSSSIRSQFGYNEASMSIELYKNKTLPSQPKTFGGKAIRYVEDLILKK
jgi:carbamoyl-phosphate synthase large subunit